MHQESFVRRVQSYRPHHQRLTEDAALVNNTYKDMNQCYNLVDIGCCTVLGYFDSSDVPVWQHHSQFHLAVQRRRRLNTSQPINTIRQHCSAM